MACMIEMSCNTSCSVFGIQTPLKIRKEYETIGRVGL